MRKVNFVHPDWRLIDEELSAIGYSTSELQDLWNSKCLSWLEGLKSSLVDVYSIYTTENFFLLSPYSATKSYDILWFFEDALKKILRTFHGVVCDEGYGRHVVIIFSDHDTYIEYLTSFYGEEDYSIVHEGIMVDLGYLHFAFPDQDFSITEAVFVHEITRACLNCRNIPIWLEEGIAGYAESVLTGYSELSFDKSTLQLLTAFWRKESLKQFWTGESFFASAESAKMSRMFSQLLVNVLLKDFDKFVRFTNFSTDEGSLFASFEKIFGVSLDVVVAELLDKP